MQVNQPEILALVDGIAIPGAVGLEVESLGYFSADRYNIVFALGAAGFSDIAFFAGLGGQTITIQLALQNAGFVTLIVGQIDNIRVDLGDNTATLSGRDLSAALIDAEIAEMFANQTASQIAFTIAARHGLLPNVSATTTPVGQYYELDHARSALSAHARATTEWNLLSWLAQIENFELSVTGTTLNFGPAAVVLPVFLTTQNFINMTLDVAASLPKAVTVQSWNSRNKTVNTQSMGSGNGTTLIRPNLTTAQAGTFATNYLANFAQHATSLSATMPGDLSLLPGAKILLAGTNSPLDQLYTVQSVSRALRARSGFTQSLRAYATT